MKNFNTNIILFISLFSLSLNIETQNAYSSLDAISLDELYQNFEANKISEIILASIEGMKTYVYSDIILSPPDETYYPKINITEELMNINTLTDRPFYEFYREYRKALNKIKDINLLVLPEKINLENNIIDFSKYSACLPFKFRMDYDDYNETKIFIKDFPYCSNYYDKNIKDFILNHENVSLVSINGINPFDFIQNFGKDFYDTKNPHARFTMMLRNIHCFFLNMIPLNADELSGINFSFGGSDEEKLILDYYVIKTENLFNKNENSLVDLKKFENFFNAEMKNKQGFGNILEIKNKFLKFKNLYNNNLVNDEDNIKWNYQSVNGALKCKVDENHKLNIFLQTTFEEVDLNTDFNFIIQCIELFYSNDYKIVGIESNSLGGSFKISYFLAQILQPKIYFKYNLAQRKNSYNYLYYLENKYNIYNPDTCLPFNDISDFIGTSSDYYGMDVIHSRTNIYNMVSKTEIQQINKLRERLLKKGFSKKPTDILIFTDYISSGAAGLFIKSLQENGAAIIAGYLGNPKNNENYDSTENFALYEQVKNTEINYMFSKNGFEIKSIAYVELFGNDYKNEEKTLYPLEYKITKVDEKTNIIHEFNNNSYNEFIKEAKAIFKKYNEDKKCSINNPNLFYESNNCSNPEEHIYGGYICENGFWSEYCKDIYCDVGYIYDINSQKCIIDPCTTIQYIELNFEGEKEYQIMPNMSYIFQMESPVTGYSFESSEDNLILHSNFVPCPRFCIIKNFDDKLMYVNYYQNISEPVILKVTGFGGEGSYYSYRTNDIMISQIQYEIGKIYYVLQFNQKEFGYINSFDKGNKLFFSEYNSDISLNDVININTEFFNDTRGKLIEFDPKKIYIIAMDVSSSFVQIYVSASLENTITIYENNYNMLYLESGKEYNLEIMKNKYPYLIKLLPISKSESSLDIRYLDEIQTLNSTYKYYIPSLIEDNNTYIINNIKENIFIEILSSLDEDSTQILNEKNIDNIALEKELTLIEYIYDEQNKNIEIYLSCNGYYQLSVYAGPTKSPYFYYSKKADPQYSDFWTNNYQIKLNYPINNIQFEEGEKYYISIFIKKRSDDQVINLTYYYNNNPIEDLYDNLTESYITDLISNLSTIINGYVYLDYAQNPEYLTNYTHKPIDIISELNKINKTERKFYEFYRELKEILGTVRDLHFNIISHKSPSGKIFSKYSACIPFRFYVDKDPNDNNETKLYIKYFESCAIFFDESVKNYVKNKSESKIPLKSIDGKDPFEYLQNWGWKYFGVKNPHGEFTMKKDLIHSFYLNDYPYSPDELNIKYEFETNDIDNPDFIVLDYYILSPNYQQINKLNSDMSNDLLQAFNEEEFDQFFTEEMKRYTNIIQKPDIFEMLKRYKEKKGILEENIEKEKIKWDYQTLETNGIKCREDKENKVNVFLQKTFLLDRDVYYAVDVIKNCTKMFYGNDYPIIGIEDKNGGGIIILAELFHQLLQIKTQDHIYSSGRSTELYKQEFIYNLENTINIETCKPFNNIDEFMDGIIDDYSTKDKNIIHKRTKAFDFMSKDLRKEVNEARLENKKAGKSKRPTDIIIYTDGFSFSATSMFIKGFQNTGGAIIVGYNGNPKLSDDLFDASQSPTNVITFSQSAQYQNLYDLGFMINGISASETFTDDYKEKNAKPREYQFDPIDERVDIYNSFTEDDYKLFVDKAKDIFKKYNEEKRCNHKNKNLLFDPDDGKTCYNFNGDPYAHGGFVCGDDDYWKDGTCQKYYCDIGYYYDTYEKKCKVDLCINDPYEKEKILDGEYFDTIIINEKNNTEYVFHINNEEYIYFFQIEGEEGYIHYDYNIPCPNLCVVQYPNQLQKYTIHLNYYRNATEKNTIVHISSVHVNPGSTSTLSEKFDIDRISSIMPLNVLNSFYVFEGYVDYAIYFQTFAQNTIIRMAEYNKIMDVMDIFSLNENYFSDFNDKLLVAESNKIYIIVIHSSNDLELNKPFKLLLQPKNLSSHIEIVQDKTALLYLPQNEQEYILDFFMNSKDRLIQLSHATLEGEIEIINEQTQENITLNKDNLYYKQDTGIFNGKLIFKVKKSALIEFLVRFTDTVEILKEKEYNNYKIKETTILTFENNNWINPIYIKIFSENKKPFKYGMMSGFTLDKYSHFSNSYIVNNLLYEYKSSVIEVKIPNITLNEGEYFYLMLIIDNEVQDQFYQILLDKTEKFSIDIFNVEFPESSCQNVIQNVIKIVEEGYAYTDIIKNPPNKEYFGKYDLLEQLKKIETNNRKFYDFYRDIRRITAQMKDLHFNIFPEFSPNNINIESIEICLPFSFYIKGSTKETAQIYIEINEDCFNLYTQEQQDFINSHLDKALLSINNTGPFDFIQNLQSEFNSVHNKHAEFSKNLENAHKLSLIHNPLTEEQISNIGFSFGGGENITLSYYLNNKKFEDNNKKIINDEKDLKNWKYSTKLSNGIKCLVDEQ